MSVSLTATDNPRGTGVKQLTYTLNSPLAPPQTVSVSTRPASVGVSTPGLSTLTYASSDIAGNQELTHSLSIVVGGGSDDFLPFSCAAPTPAFSLPAHGSLLLNGTLSFTGQTFPTKVIRF